MEELACGVEPVLFLSCPGVEVSWSGQEGLVLAARRSTFNFRLVGGDLGRDCTVEDRIVVAAWLHQLARMPDFHYHVRWRVIGLF